MSKKENNEELDFDLEDLFLEDDFGVENSDDETDAPDEPIDWNLVRALDRVLNEAHHSELRPSFFTKAAAPLTYLRERLQMTDIQIVILAMLIDSGRPLSWKMMATYLNISRLSMMVYTEDVEELVARGWCHKRGAREMGGMYEGYALVYGVVTAVRNDKVFQPTPITNLSLQDFVDRVANRFQKNMHDRELEFKDDEMWMMRLVDANPQLEICEFLANLECDIHAKALFMLIVSDYTQWADTDNEGLGLSDIDNSFPEDYECDFLRRHFENGNHPLFQFGYVEHKCEDGIADNTTFVLTAKAKSDFLSSYKPHKAKRNGRHSNKNLTDHSKITAKSMYYNDSEEAQLQQLTNLLGVDKLQQIQERLEQMGMRKGFACLFYGAPGTGKTESVLQISRLTGRDLMQVDIAGMRDKYVGESEKNIKAVFTRYRAACEDAKANNVPLPILFFNEADAIISKRTENIERSVEKMDNAMQNIILQEIENLEGILIATTNLTSNLDKAFERRFIYKVEFRKPQADVKAKIWQSMIKHISESDAATLAKRYDFSGGQIENIARKSAVEFILTGQNADFEKLDKLCQAELLDSKQQCQHIAGFSASA